MRTRDSRELNSSTITAGRGEQEAEGVVRSHPILPRLWVPYLNRFGLKQSRAALRARVSECSTEGVMALKWPEGGKRTQVLLDSSQFGRARLGTGQSLTTS